MTEQPGIPDPQKVKQTVANLRKTRLEMEESRLELEEINAKLEHDIRLKRLQRVRGSLSVLAEASQASEQNVTELSRSAIAPLSKQNSY